MKISRTFQYAAPPAAVFAMMANPAFQGRKLEEAGALSHTESVTPKGDQTEILTTRVMSTSGFPDYARKLTGPQLSVSESILWSPAGGDGSRTGTINIAVGSLPIAMIGTVRLTPTSDGTEVDIDGDLKARIPLMGGKIEKAAEGPVVSAIDSEAEVGHAWLAEAAG